MITRIALSLALAVALVSSASAQQKPDFEPMKQATEQPKPAAPTPQRDHAGEAQKRLQSKMDARRSCLVSAGLTETKDFIVRGPTKISVRDGVWNAQNTPAVSKCLEGAN